MGQGIQLRGSCDQFAHLQIRYYALYISHYRSHHSILFASSIDVETSTTQILQIGQYALYIEQLVFIYFYLLLSLRLPIIFATSATKGGVFTTPLGLVFGNLWFKILYRVIQRLIQHCFLSKNNGVLNLQCVIYY